MQVPASDPAALAEVWASMRSAAGTGSLQALLASIEPVSLEGDTLRVRGRRYDLAIIEQRRAELSTLAARARQRETELVVIEADQPAQQQAKDNEPTQTPAEAAMEIPLVRQTAELFEGTVVRALRRTDT